MPRKCGNKKAFKSLLFRNFKPVYCNVLEIGSGIREDREYYRGNKCVRLISGRICLGRNESGLRSTAEPVVMKQGCSEWKHMNM